MTRIIAIVSVAAVTLWLLSIGANVGHAIKAKTDARMEQCKEC